ncbi:MAG: glycosyltransferase family 4 protein [Planctomycetes bacterium]|nr:glycosyltransferase family 4 protein [Planctomycetota bacterium]
MRIALVAEWVDAWRGGAETSTTQFIHCLMDRGVEIHLFTRSRPSPTPGMQVHTVSGAAMSRTRKTITFMHRVDRLIRSQSFDVVHAISPCRSADIYQPRGGTVAESIERNISLHRNGASRSLKRYANRFNFKQRFALMVERQLLGDRDGPIVVAISDYVVAQLKRHYDLPDARIRRIYNGVDPDDATDSVRAQERANVREEFGISQNDCLVVLIAHNFRLKGVRVWMEALSMLLKQGVTDVRSLVIGKGDSERWHRLAARLGVAEHLTFTGPTDRVRAFQHAADVLVHPTFYDPCSRVVLESLSAGLACITTRWDGASEMIRDGLNGYVLDDPRDVDALADRIRRLRDPDHRRRLGEAARQVGDRVSMARHADAMLDLYGELAPSGSPRHHTP